MSLQSNLTRIVEQTHEGPADLATYPHLEQATAYLLRCGCAGEGLEDAAVALVEED